MRRHAHLQVRAALLAAMRDNGRSGAVARRLYKHGESEVLTKLVYPSSLWEDGTCGNVNSLRSWNHLPAYTLFRLFRSSLLADARTPENVRNVQNLEKTLDAAILTKTTVHSNVHDIITALSKGNYKKSFLQHQAGQHW